MRGIDPDLGALKADNDERDMQLAAPLPGMMAIDGTKDGRNGKADHYAIAPAAGANELRDFNSEHSNDESNGHNGK